MSIANNTPYGLAASIWSENINLALDIAPKIKAGVIWINSTNLFDAACGFGGYKESGFGREGGIEGIRAYQLSSLPETSNVAKKIIKNKVELPSIDATPKLYVGGKQKRPDSGYSFNQLSAQKEFICDIARANRKDVRDTVEAASKSKIGSLNNFNRSQILFYLAENLSQRKETFVNLLMSISGVSKNQALKEFEDSCERIFYYASMADKFEGNIHNPPMRGLTLAVKESIGVVASIMNDHQPLLSISTVISSLFANGNASIVVPSEKTSLIATSLYQVFETSDIPPGSINILTTKTNELNDTLSQHENIHGIWAFSGDAKVRSSIINGTVFNLKRYWCPKNINVDWSNTSEEFLNAFLYEGSQVKNIWIPYGE